MEPPSPGLNFDQKGKVSRVLLEDFANRIEEFNAALQRASCQLDKLMLILISSGALKKWDTLACAFDDSDLGLTVSVQPVSFIKSMGSGV